MGLLAPEADGQAETVGTKTPTSPVASLLGQMRAPFSGTTLAVIASCPMKLLVVLLLLGLALPASANEWHRRLLKLSPSERNVVFTNVMKSSGEADCVVTESFFQGTDPKKRIGDAFWNVRCANKKAFSVSVNDDSGGSTRILECEFLKAVAHVECFKKFGTSRYEKPHSKISPALKKQSLLRLEDNLKTEEWK